MKFGACSVPPDLIEENVIVGNVYAAKGNRPTVAWVVVAVRGTMVAVLGIDADGAVCSAQNYGAHAMARRDIIGFCAGIEAMQMDIEWRGVPRSFTP